MRRMKNTNKGIMAISSFLCVLYNLEEPFCQKKNQNDFGSTREAGAEAVFGKARVLPNRLLINHKILFRELYIKFFR